jgi:hypothetical protein
MRPRKQALIRSFLDLALLQRGQPRAATLSGIDRGALSLDPRGRGKVQIRILAACPAAFFQA